MKILRTRITSTLIALAAFSQAAFADASFVVVSGSPQSTIVGTQFPAPLVVQVTDGNGNGVPNAAVIFGGPLLGAGATLDPLLGLVVLTDSNGNASATATANGTVGSYTITASSLLLPTLNLSLTNQAAASVALSAPQSTITQGTSVTFTAAVSGSDPTGTVDFNDGATTICPAVALAGGTATCTTSALAPATHSITAVYSGDTLNAGPVASAPFVVVVRGSQAITFTQPADTVFGVAAFELVATGGASGNPVTFSTSTTSVCTLGGTNNHWVTVVGVGSCTVTADQAGNVNYDPAPSVSTSFAVTQATQAITFAQPADKVFGSASFTLSATGGASGNAVTFSTSTPSVCTLSGATVTLVGVGTCTVTADQAGNATYSAAPSVARSFAVTQATQAITFAQPADMVLGSASFALSATGGASGNAVTFSTSTASVCALSGTNGQTVTLVGTGTCTVTANQAGNANYSAAAAVSRSFNVARGQQAIVFPQPADKPLGAAPFTISATGGASGNPVTFSTSTFTVCALAGTNNSTVVVIGAGTCTITANQAGNANYDPAPAVTTSFNVAKATQTISLFTPPASKNFGDAAFTLTATGGASGNPVTFTSTSPTVCTLSGTNNATVTLVGVGNCFVTANQLGNSNYADATPVSATIAVAAVLPGAPTIGTATPGPATAAIAFTAPTFTGGSAIIDYKVTCSPGNGTKVGTASPITLTGLSNIAYTCSVQARNAIGLGASSASVTVTPLPTSFSLTVSTAGNGSGNVTSAPTGITCPTVCSATFTNNTSVTLTPSAAAGSQFTGWAGACSGQGACIVAMDASKSVTANFVLRTTPDPFSFVLQSNVQPGMTITSNTVTITGLGTQATITVSGGSYSIGCGATFVTTPGTITGGQTVCVRHSAVLALSAGTNTTLTIGPVSATFTSITAATLDPALDADHDGIPNGVEATVGRNPLAKDNDVFGNATLFVMQQYRDILRREGDAAGVSAWAALITAGTYDRPHVIDAFLSSADFDQYVGSVARLYFATFLRVPDYAGFTFNAGLVRNGTVTLTQLADFFTQSPEFAATYGSLNNTQFVTLLYNNVLGRAPDPAGLSGWVALLTTGGYSRGQVLTGFSESTEYKASMANEVFITMMYSGLLARSPDPAGFSGWLNAMDAGTYTHVQVINAFMASAEYHNRFLP